MPSSKSVDDEVHNFMTLVHPLTLLLPLEPRNEGITELVPELVSNECSIQAQSITVFDATALNIRNSEPTRMSN